MSATDKTSRLKEENKNPKWKRDFHTEELRVCASCADLRLSTRDFCDGIRALENCMPAVAEDGERGCSFCALVSRSCSRQDRTLDSVPWERITRQMTTQGFVLFSKLMIGPKPRRKRFPMPFLDSAKPSGLPPILSIQPSRTNCGRYRAMAKPYRCTLCTRGLCRISGAV